MEAFLESRAGLAFEQQLPESQSNQHNGIMYSAGKE